MMKTKCLSPLKHALVILLGAVLLLGLWPGFVLADDAEQPPQAGVEAPATEDEKELVEEPAENLAVDPGKEKDTEDTEDNKAVNEADDENVEAEEVAKNTYLFYVVVDDVKEENAFFEQSCKDGDLIQMELPTIQDHLFQGAVFAGTLEAFDLTQPVQVSADSNGRSIEVLLIYTAGSATPPPPTPIL